MLLGDVIGVVHVIHGRRDVICRGPLQYQLPIGALALLLFKLVNRRLWHRVNIPWTWTIHLIFLRNATPLSCTSAPILIRNAGETAPAGAHQRLLTAAFAFGDAGGDGHAKFTVGKSLGVETRVFRGDTCVLGRLVHHTLGRKVDAALTDLQRTGSQQVDGGANAAAGHQCVAALGHGHTGDHLRSDILEVERTTTGGARQLATVQGHQVEFRVDAAHGYLTALAVDTVDGHTSDALHGFSQVGIGELTDVFGRDGVDDAVAVALDVHGFGQTAADTGNGDLFQRSGIRLLRHQALRQRSGTQGDRNG